MDEYNHVIIFGAPWVIPLLWERCGSEKCWSLLRTACRCAPSQQRAQDEWLRSHSIGGLQDTGEHSPLNSAASITSPTNTRFHFPTPGEHFVWWALMNSRLPIVVFSHLTFWRFLSDMVFQKGSTTEPGSRHRLVFNALTTSLLHDQQWIIHTHYQSQPSHIWPADATQCFYH